MQAKNHAAPVWLVVGIALLVAGILADRNQPLWFAAATVVFAASIALRRKRR